MITQGEVAKARIMDEATMRRSINRITFEIIERNQGVENLVIIGVRRRGIVLAHRIGQKLKELEGVEVPVIDLDVTSYRDDIDPSHRARKIQLSAPITGRRVVLVDDVLYTGRTVRAAIDAIMDAGRPECIQLAVMVDRGHRELPIRPDFVGKNLPTSKNEIVHVLVHEIDGAEAVLIDE